MIRRAAAQTEFGPVTVFWKDLNGIPLIVRILLPDRHGSLPVVFPSSEPGTCNEIDVVLTGILEMFQGIPVHFHLDSVDLDLCTVFQRKVLLAEFAIPRGCVSTYSLLAAHLGVPGGARAVGNALARNPFPLIIPCHRAVRSDLTTGGFQGGAGMKKHLLESEGVTFNARGRIQSCKWHYDSKPKERSLT